MPTTNLTSGTSVSSVPVTPDFVLDERPYAEKSVQYDPDTGVLTVLRDRLTQPEDVQIVLPVAVEGQAVEVEFVDGSRAVARDDALVLPPITMYAELPVTIAFTPPATASGTRPPPVKVKISIRVRPTGGG